MKLAEDRTKTYYNKKIVYVSTPTVQGSSRIETEFENSTKEDWNVPCPECGEFQPLNWENLKYNKEDLSVIYYACAHCGVLSTETKWKKQTVKGKYIAANPERESRGFHINALTSNFETWKNLVLAWIKANDEKDKGNIELLKTFKNQTLGELWIDEHKEISSDLLYERREVYGCEVPNEVLYITAGIDTQDDRLEVEVVGWGKNYESYGILYKRVYGDIHEETTKKKLDDLLYRTFERKDGRQMRIEIAAMDSGGHRTDDVYEYCVKRSDKVAA